MKNIKLRPWQQECVAKSKNWLQADNENKHFLINAAPGSGKTLCASVIAGNLFAEELISRVVVIAPRKAVVAQWANEFKSVTNRPMLQITAAEEQPETLGMDLCATWAAIKGLLKDFQTICQKEKTLVICDEHHHAAIEAAWGKDASGAFNEAKYVLILTGTPIRSDKKESVWLAHDDEGVIKHPEKGTYTLNYGQAVELGYCRPITFHRHEGNFSVVLGDGENISVSGTKKTKFSPKLKRISGLQQALDYYKLACTPNYLKNGKVDMNSYQATMLEWGIAKLNELQLRMPDAAGLVIAPNILVAEYMAKILEKLDGEKPIVVHNKVANAEGKIKAFRESNKRWIISVAMISEGVDIPRLRVLVYLPNAQTELSFRQAMGRVVRNNGPDDNSRAYVVMPTHNIFEKYATRVENEMPPSLRSEPKTPNTKICPSCYGECAKDAKVCPECGEEFPKPMLRTKNCEKCGGENSASAKICKLCGASLEHDFEISLEEALRVGAIVRGMELSEEEVREGEKLADGVRKNILESGDENLIRLLGQIPEEAFGRLASILKENKK